MIFDYYRLNKEPSLIKDNFFVFFVYGKGVTFNNNRISFR